MALCRNLASALLGWPCGGFGFVAGPGLLGCLGFGLCSVGAFLPLDEGLFVGPVQLDCGLVGCRCGCGLVGLGAGLAGGVVCWWWGGLLVRVDG